MKQFWILSVLFAASCAPIRPPQPPAPPIVDTFNVACVVTDAFSHQPVAGASCTITGQTAPTNGDGYALLLHLLGGPGVQQTLGVSKEGYLPAGKTFTNDNDQNVAIALTPDLPPAPTRDQVLASNLVFQGLTMHTQAFGDLGWFDAALFSPQLAPERPSIFAQKRAAGDTAAVLLFYGDSSFYNEPGQPYEPFTNPDYEHHLPQFCAAVLETLSNGFTPWIYMQGDGPDNFSIAMRQFPIAHDTLAHCGPRDLNLDVLYKPGWDSVFYGWEPSHEKIPAFSALVRSLCPDCRLGLEFNTGHIPIGEGGSDYAAGGDMQGYDLLDVEFDDGNLHADSTWQILGRLLGPAYVRPAEQPGGDDPRPPFYLATQTPRGRWYVNCFEYAEYEWVRNTFTRAHVDEMRAYLRSLGCSQVG